MGDGFAAQGIYEEITNKDEPCRRCYGTGVRYVPIGGDSMVEQPCLTCGGHNAGQ